MKFLLLITLFFVSYSNAQEKLSVYKSVADKRVGEDIKLGRHDILKVVNLFLITDSLGNGRALKYALNKSKRIKFLKAVFTYEFFKSDLNYAFRFVITIYQTKTIEFDSGYSFYIPACALKNLKCNLISRDSALKIARKDSFPSGSFTIDLIRQHEKDNFFWYIVGTAEQRAADSIKPCRVIDAMTGLIVSRKRSWVPKR